MKLNKTRLLLTLALFSQSTFAVEHVDASIFNERVINFDLAADVASAADEEKSSPYFSLLNLDASKAIFEAKLTSLTMAKVKMADGNIYDRIILPDGGGPVEPGKPNLTGYQQLIRIPDGAQLNIVIDEVEWSDTFKDTLVDPVQLPFPDVVEMDGSRPDQNMPFVKDEAAYSLMTEAQTPPVTVVETVRVRGKSYAVISYRPMDFSPIEKTVRFAKKVRFHVNYSLPKNKGGHSKRTDQLGFDAPTDSVIDIRSKAEQSASPALQAQPSAQNNAALTPAQNADYLIITADRFKDAIAPLAAWKRQKGYKVHVATVTETGNTQEDIKKYISDAYSNGTMTSYVLLVGDHEDIPAWEITGHGYHGKNHKWHTDFEYTLVDGTDKYPDLVLGRLPGDTEAQITSMVTRTLNYEKTPVDSERYNNVLLAGQYQDNDGNRKADRMFMEDLHRVADFLGPDYDFFDGPGDLFNKGFQIHTALQWDADLSKELKYGGWDYGSARVTPPSPVPQAWKNQGNGNHVQISDAINQGVSLVMHRDHGYGDGSGWADPRYTATEVNALANGNMSPVVFSLNCATGWFDGKDSFAESWMRNPNGGAVGFTGAVRVSYSGYNDLMHAAIMDSFWDDYDGNWSSNIYPVSWRPAMAVNRAKHRLFSHYGTQGTALSTARFFSWFGDPELELRTQRPQALTVTYPENIASGTQSAFDVVVQSNNGARLKDARVALVAKSGQSHVVTTDDNGVAHFDITPTESMTITVTEHNAPAYEGEISVGGNTSITAKVPASQASPARQWVVLDGTQSVFAEGTKVHFQWTQIEGPNVRIDYADKNYAYAITPDYSTTLKFKLTITDENGNTDSAIQTIVVKSENPDNNKAPIAIIPEKQIASFSQWAALDGTQATDPDGSISQYQWSQVSGPKVKIAYPTSRYAYALTPNVNAKLTFQLTVTDDKGKSSSSTQTMIVQ
ncbi:C25 family cysteine peptidase [Photobacterium swingsii]|uniref:C25 family cysteine peptidase n=1 Tax=Photobacterium swingsii TaxID=680026 RepID=UPI00352D8C31